MKIDRNSDEALDFALELGLNVGEARGINYSTRYPDKQGGILLLDNLQIWRDQMALALTTFVCYYLM